MLTEDQLAARLRTRLHTEFDGIPVRTDLAVIVRRRLRRRTLALRAGVAATVAVAMAAAGTFVAADRASITGHSAATNAVPPGDIHDVNYVVARTAAAIDAASDNVVGSHITGNGQGHQMTQAWRDLKTGRTRIDILDLSGVLLSSQSYDTDMSLGPNALLVDYAKRTWYTEKEPAFPGAKGVDPLPFGAGDDVLNVRAKLAAGSLRLIGTEQLDGREVLHLQEAGTGRYIIDVLVEENTFLPIRETTTLDSESGSTDLTWLPRTPANLAKLDLAPPPGYTHLAKRPLPTITTSANG